MWALAIAVPLAIVLVGLLVWWEERRKRRRRQPALAGKVTVQLLADSSELREGLQRAHDDAVRVAKGLPPERSG